MREDVNDGCELLIIGISYNWEQEDSCKRGARHQHKQKTNRNQAQQQANQADANCVIMTISLPYRI